MLSRKEAKERSDQRSLRSVVVFLSVLWMFKWENTFSLHVRVACRHLSCQDFVCLRLFHRHVFQSSQQDLKSPRFLCLQTPGTPYGLAQNKSKKNFDIQHFWVKNKQKNHHMWGSIFLKICNLNYIKTNMFIVWKTSPPVSGWQIKESTRGCALIRHSKLYSSIFIWMFLLLSLMDNLNLFSI